MFKCIIGLGNPSGYDLTRHNVGKIFLDSLSSSWTTIAEGHMSTYNSLILLKTNTYMNISGPPIKSFLKKNSISLSEILVAYDDADLVLGKAKIKNEGSASGHNGIKSIIKSLASDKFRRLKIGVSRPSSDDISDYILSNFTKNELEILHSQSFPLCSKLIFPPIKPSNNKIH